MTFARYSRKRLQHFSCSCLFFIILWVLKHTPNWPQTHDPPTFTFQVLGLWACVLMPESLEHSWCLACQHYLGGEGSCVASVEAVAVLQPTADTQVAAVSTVSGRPQQPRPCSMQFCLVCLYGQAMLNHSPSHWPASSPPDSQECACRI